MSRGPGWLQRYLFRTIAQHGKPITFAELRNIALASERKLLRPSCPSDERALRRALQGLVRDKSLVALGSGGRSDPHSYGIDPVIIMMIGKQDWCAAWYDLMFPEDEPPPSTRPLP